MPSDIPQTSRLRWFTRLWRWLAGAVGLALLVTALIWAVLLFWVMPRLDAWRPAMQTWASEQLGMAVHIGEASGASNGWRSTLVLRQVQLQGPNGQAALSLPELNVQLSPASLWRQTLDRVILKRPRLDIWRDAQGRLWVGGVLLPEASGAEPDDARVWDALLTVRRLRIEDGTLHWRDERLDSEGLTVTGVAMELRNRNHRHALSLSATPPEDWGAPFSAKADLRTPLLSNSVRSLRGTASLHFPDLRVTALRRHLDAGLDLQSAQGALTASAELKDGALKQVTLKGEVSRIQARFAHDLTPLDLRNVAGELLLQPEPDGFTLTGEGLRFETAGGLAWNDAKVRVHSTGLSGAQSATRLHAQRVNLAALRHVLGTLPLDASVRAAMRRHLVAGWVDSVEAAWSRDAQGTLRYSAKGQATGLSVVPTGGIPGLQGLDTQFAFNEAGGEASLAMQGGRLSFPSVFKEPSIPVSQLSAQARWTLAGDDWAVKLQNLKVSNADAEGEFNAEWRTLPVADLPAGASRFPGALNLTGALTRADGTRVHRYLPDVVGDEAIRYVREAVQAGKASHVGVTVRGNLDDFPFSEASSGLFRIAAKVSGVRLNYVPQHLQPAGEPAWPALTDVQGLLVFEGAGMRVEGASGSVQGFPGIRFGSIATQIPDLEHTEVLVQATAQTDVSSGLRFVQASPVAQWLEGALDGMQATGDVGLQLKLKLPVAHIENSQVQGDVLLQGNEVVLLDAVPRLREAQGRVHFTERGFALQDVQAHGVGGLVRLSGGTEARAAGASAAASGVKTVIRAQGQATAQGLRDEPALSFLRPLLGQATGESAYQVAYTVDEGQVRVQVLSELQGMAMHWPAPLNKPAADRWPLAVAIDPVAGGDVLSVSVGEWLAARYARAEQADHSLRVRAGVLALGTEAVDMALQRMPAQGVKLQVDWPNLDGQAWQLAWQEKLQENGVSSSTAQFSGGDAQYLPNEFDVRLSAVQGLGRTLRHLHVQGAQRDGQWLATVNTEAAAGQVAFSPEGDGHLRVRLKHLHVPDAAATPTEAGAVAGVAKASDPTFAATPSATKAGWPSLDVVVQDLRVGEKQLGQLSLQASHRAGDADDGTWLLKSVRLESEGGRLNASGAWLPPDAQGTRQTRLQFELVVDDGGELLRRLAMPGVVKGGAGVLHGVMRWHGPAFAPVLSSLQGEVHAELVRGQFLKADPGLAKLLGVLSLQSLPRRLSLDFRDVFSQGFAFDFIRGDAQVAAGVANTNNLQMKGVNAAVLMEGQADLSAQTQDLRALVVPRIDAGNAALVATIINPAVGLGTFVAQLLLSQQINEAVTRTLHITGDWDDPQVQQLPGNALHAPPPAAPKAQEQLPERGESVASAS